MLPPVTIDLIVSKDITEGAAYEFKQQIDLDDARQKSNFVDDVVAFLNARAGSIIVGVRERGGAYDGFSPQQGDPEKRSRQVLSILQDNIYPSPLHLDVRTLPIDGGFLLVIDIPEHVMRPYQNRINGAFYLRTGGKNTPISRQELGAHFVSEDQYERDLDLLLAEADAHIARRGRMVTGRATLTVGILPRAYYERGRPVFNRGERRLKPAPLFRSGPKHFDGCEGGHEVIASDMHGLGYSRTFLSNRWFTHAHVVYPIDTHGEHPNISEFRDVLGNYMGDLSHLLTGENVHGPFCVQLEMRGLSSDEKLGWLFPGIGTISLPRPALLERLDDPGTLDTFYSLVRAASRFN